MPPSPSVNACVDIIKTVGDKYVVTKLTTESPYSYHAGQYCFIFFTDEQGEFSRPYSIASAPSATEQTNNSLDFCWLSSGDPRTVSAIKSLKPGDKIRLSEAAGRFEQPKQDRRCVFIAGGSGISPLRSMLNFDLTKSPVEPRTLLYGCENSEAIPYRDEFVKLAAQHPQFSLHLYVSTPSATSGSERQGLPTDHLADHIDKDTDYFLCGPPAMMELARQRLLALGVTEEQIFQDRY